MNYFKENIHFCKFFFIKNISGKQIFFFFEIKKKSTDSVGKGFDIAQHDAVVALKKKKKQKYLWTLFFRGLYISLQPTYIRYIVILSAQLLQFCLGRGLGFYRATT